MSHNGAWGRLPLVETIADGLVGDAGGALFALEEEVEQPEVDAPASPKEGRACHVVGGHGQGVLAQAASGEGGEGDEGGRFAGESVSPEGDRGIGASAGPAGVAQEGEREDGGRMHEWEPWGAEVAGVEEGVFDRDMAVAVWDRAWAVTLASRSSCVATVAAGWGRMSWNGSKGREGSRRTARVAEVIEGSGPPPGRCGRERRMPRGARPTARPGSWVERGKVNCERRRGREGMSEG